MLGIEVAILRTVLYADVFQFPMTPQEIHHFLIADAPASFSQVEQALASPVLKKLLIVKDGYVMRAGRDELAALRREREQVASRLWGNAVTYGVWLGRLPFVRMVVMTGALSMRNPSMHDDDLDYMLVTTAGRVWLARAFAIVVVRLGKLQGITVCPNYVVAETALYQERHNLFIAHEVVQMVPVCGHAHYQAMRDQNAWVLGHLPNARAAFYDESELAPRGFWRITQRLIEGVLGGAVGDRLEAWEYRRKAARFARQLQTPHSTAVIDPENVKGHFKDHGHPVLHRYEALLRDYDIKPYSLPVAGD